MTGWRLLLSATALGLISTCAFGAGAAVAFVFKAPRYSTLEAEPSGPGRFVLVGVEQSCKREFYSSGTYYRRTLELVPVYDECQAKALGGLPSEFVIYGCAYLVRADNRPERQGHWTARVDLTCRPTFSLRWQVYESTETFESAVGPMCTTKMYPQSGIGTAELTNVRGRPDEIEIHWRLDHLEYEAYGFAFFCGVPAETTKLAGTHYTGHARVRALGPGEKPLGLSVSE